METVLDLIVVLAVIVAAVRGWRVGLSGFAFRLAGLLAGALLGWKIRGWLLTMFDPSPSYRTVVVVAGVVVLAVVGASLGQAVGNGIGSLLSRIHLRLPDRAAGAVARSAVALVLCWVVAGVVVALAPPSRLTSALRDSQMLSAVTDTLGTPGDALERAQQLR